MACCAGAGSSGLSPLSLAHTALSACAQGSGPGDMENCLAAAALNGVDRRALQRTARLGQEVLERAKRRAVDWHSRELPKSGVGVTSRERPYRERRPAAGPQRLLRGEREDRQPTLSASFRTMAEFMDYTSSQCGSLLLSNGSWPESCPTKAADGSKVMPNAVSLQPPHRGSDLFEDFRGLSREQRYYSSVLEEGGAAHVSRYHRGKSELHWCWAGENRQRKDTSLGLGGISHVAGCALAATQLAENTSKDLYIEVYPGTYSVTVGTNDLTKTQVVAVDSGQSVDLVFPV